MSNKITPPPELVQQWYDAARGPRCEQELATQAARWGADQELEACCAAEHTVYGKGKADWLRSMRRPKPPSLAEKALEQLSGIRTAFKVAYGGDLVDDPIRTALERLQELEEESSGYLS